MTIKSFVTASAFLLASATQATTAEPVDYVNPLIGTALKGEGGTAPFVGRPFAMTNFLPQTRENKMGTMAYVYDDTEISGFLASHQPTVWMGDYGYVSVMPQTGGDIRTLPSQRKLPFSHKDEKATPYRYTVSLQTPDRKKIKAEITAASRCGLLKFTYPKTDSARIVVQGINLNPELADWCNDYGPRLASVKGWIMVDTMRNEIIGYNPDRQSSQIGPDLPNFKGYFVIRPDKRIKRFGTWSADSIFAGRTETAGTRCGAYADFQTKAGEAVTVQVGTSFISIDQARENINRELPGFDQESLAASTRREWNGKLSKIQIGGVDDTTKRIFYTAMFHCYLFPREFSEFGRYYSAFDDTVHDGESYNDFSLWDTFRAFHPLMTILEPELTGRWITALLQMYREGGWMPIWPNPTYTNIMIGTHGDALIADAYMKGLRNYDVSLAYEAMRKNAMTPPDCDTSRRYGDRDRWTSFEGRAGASFYHSLGYVADDRTAESVSRTLEYAYDDWCVAQLARELGKVDDYERLMQWAGNYRNQYNAEKGFMLPRNYDGSWIDLDDHDRHGLTEGSKWTYLFCVLHDIPGMIELMGGKDAFAAKLDRNFNEGHYRHDNEPGHHYIYLYNDCDQPWKTQELVRKHTRLNYHDKPDGLNGNDDCGQMSAWYLFSVMGFYPVTPGSNNFAIGAPQYPEITITLDTPAGPHRLVISADNLSEKNMYVANVTVDRTPVTEPRITWDDITRAHNIRFTMTDRPSNPWRE